MRRLVMLAAVAASLAAPAAGAQRGAAWVPHRTAEFSIQLPASWADATADRRRILTESRRLVKDDPELARLIDSLLAAGTSNTAIQLFAFDLARSSLRSGFATNLNVIREKTSLTFAEWRRQSLKALLAAPFVRQPVWSRVVRLPAGKALRLTYRARFTVAGRVLEASIRQYGLLRPGAAYILTYTTHPSLAGGYRATFDRSARSFRFHGS